MEYLIDDSPGEKKWGFSLRDTITKSQKKKIFEGLTFYFHITKATKVFFFFFLFLLFLIFSSPKKQENEEIRKVLNPLVKAAGGSISSSLPPALSSPSSPPPTLKEEEEPFCDDLSTFYCISSSLTGVPAALHLQTFETEFVKLSIMRQKLEKEGHRTKVGRRRR